jgi:hypothetical protein
MKISGLISLLIICVLMTGVALSQPPDFTAKECREKNLETRKGLQPFESLLISAIDRGDVGPGKIYPWMAVMRKYGIKAAQTTVVFEFTDSKKPDFPNKFTEAQLELGIYSIRFSSDYYYFGKEVNLPDKSDSDKEIGDFIAGLRLSFLREAALDVERFGRRNIRGSLYLTLLDDPCLLRLSEIPYVEKIDNP